MPTDCSREWIFSFFHRTSRGCQVEAQCSGLSCVMSDVITREAKITSNCWFLSLKEKPEKWAEFILAHRNEKRTDAQWVGNPKNYSLEHLKQQQRELLL